MARKPTIQHRLEHGLLRCAEAGLGGVSPRAAERAGEVLGRFVGGPLAIRGSVVEANLRRAFPEAADDWIERTLRDSYRHLGREAAAMLRLSKLDPASIRSIVEIPDASWQLFQDALADGRGAILATGHYGNWELAAAAVAARGYPISAIVKRQSNPLVNDRIEAARRALGVETIDMSAAPRQVPRDLRAGRSVGIVADQDARGRGIWVPFFGVQASTHKGPALFALRFGSPILSAVARRMPDGRYQLAARRIDTRRTESLEDDVARVTAALALHLEEEIRLDPSQYFWFHKRWKSRPPGEEPATS